MLKTLEDIYYRIRFGKICNLDELGQKLSGLDVILSKSELDELFEFQISSQSVRDDNPYASPAIIKEPINDLTSYLRGAVIEEKTLRKVQITGEYFKEDLAHHKVDGIWKPKVLYHDRVSITIEKIPNSGTLYSGRIPRNMVKKFISSLPSEN